MTRLRRRRRASACRPTAFDGRSGYGPFIAVGILAGGLFSGAEGIKTVEQAQLVGGVAGEAYDRCYHKVCDTLANINVAALGQLADGVAHVTAVHGLRQVRAKARAQAIAPAPAGEKRTNPYKPYRVYGSLPVTMNRTRTPIPTVIVLILGVALASCGGSDSGSSSSAGGSAKLSLVAYSTPKEAYEEIIPAFTKTPEGKGVSFSQSYGASGDQARAVIAGLPTDVAALSLEPDISKLVKEKLVAADWNSSPTKGIVSDSIVVIGVRPGNPKQIKGWADLVKPGVEVLTPNPFTSGGARWNIMAAYGAQIEQGKSEAQAIDYLGKLFKNVAVQDKSARESLQNFTGGKGDAIVSYENEAITAKQKGEKLDYVIPDETILIENPIAVTASAGPKARAFVTYATSEPAQKVFAAKGYRSVIPALVDATKYPIPRKQFDIMKFGGWDAVMKKFFDPKDSVMQRIEKNLGVSTG